MPRTRRRTIPDVTYHLISRFVDRDWFIRTERERTTYLRLLGAAISASSWRCLGYAVMSNHIHLAMVASDQPLADWIRRPHSAFADYLNKTYKRIGAVFVRGPKSILIPDGRVGHLLAYIHNNPVRANIVRAPGDSAWTSHRYYADPSDLAPRWLSVAEGFRRTGLGDGAAFDSFVRTTTTHPVLGAVDSDEELHEKLETYEQGQIALLERPAMHRPDAYELVRIAAELSGLTFEQLRSKRRGLAEQHARAAVIVCGAQRGLVRGELAHALNVTPQAVSKMQARDELPSATVQLVARLEEHLDNVRAPLLLTA